MEQKINYQNDNEYQKVKEDLFNTATYTMCNEYLGNLANNTPKLLEQKINCFKTYTKINYGSEFSIDALMAAANREALKFINDVEKADIYKLSIAKRSVLNKGWYHVKMDFTQELECSKWGKQRFKYKEFSGIIIATSVADAYWKTINDLKKTIPLLSYNGNHFPDLCSRDFSCEFLGMKTDNGYSIETWEKEFGKVKEFHEEKIQEKTFWEKAVEMDGHIIKLIPELRQTPEICLAAVRQDGFALQFVKEQTPKICLAAVKQNRYALRYVKEQTPEICLEAVKKNGYALQYVKEQTPEICLAAVRQDGGALQFVKEQTPKICLEAVKQNEYALRYVKEQTPEICLEAVKENSKTLQFVSPQFQPLFEPLTIGDRELSIEERYALRTTKTLKLKDVLDKKGNKRDITAEMDKKGKIIIWTQIFFKQENKQTTKNRMKF